VVDRSISLKLCISISFPCADERYPVSGRTFMTCGIHAIPPTLLVSEESVLELLDLLFANSIIT
jgi:hypothetical protein